MAAPVTVMTKSEAVVYTMFAPCDTCGEQTDRFIRIPPYDAPAAQCGACAIVPPMTNLERALCPCHRSATPQPCCAACKEVN